MIDDMPIKIGIDKIVLDLSQVELSHSNPKEMHDNLDVLMECYGLLKATLDQQKEDLEVEGPI